MKFTVVSVKGHSVRVQTGIVRFDVLITEENGVKKLKVPDNIFIPSRADFNSLAGAVYYAFESNDSLGVSNDDCKSEKNR